jgi:4-carboxymuconolactone decarboxylase
MTLLQDDLAIPAMVPEETRYERGLAKLAELDAQVAAAVVAPLGDLGRYIVEFAFGDIYSRPGLSLRDRELATVAMLTVLDRGPELRVHLGLALNAGLTAGELEEVIIQTVPYAGFPTAMHALQALHEVVGSRDVS